MAVAVVSENLWCSCGNKLFILSQDEEIIKVGVLLHIIWHIEPRMENAPTSTGKSEKKKLDQVKVQAPSSRVQITPTV